MALLLRIVLIVLATILLLVVAVLLLLPTSLGSSFVEDRLRSWVHPQLQVNGQVSLSVVPRLGMDITDITIPSGQDGYPLASVKQAQWQLSWVPLLSNQLVFDTIYLEGVQVYRTQPTWEPMIQEFDRFQQMRHGHWWPSMQGMDLSPTTWQVVVKQALIENLSVVVNDAMSKPLPVITLKQAELSADGQWPRVAGSSATFGLRELSVNDADALGYAPALLEQLGIAQGNAWDVVALDSQWQLAEDAVELTSLQVSGPWGDMSVRDGRIDLASGELAIPVKANLTNAPELKTRGLQINVRRSQMQFELTGQLNQPGVQWLTQPAPTNSKP